MNILDHVHSKALSYPGGIAALAVRMGIPYSTLKSKLNPNCATHHLYVQEYERLIAILDTDDFARFHAAERDGVFVKSHKLDAVSDMELLDLFLERESRYGKFAARVRTSLEDGGIDKREYDDLMRLFDEVSETREQIKARIKSIHDQTMERESRLKAIK
ncbi:phage regulatory CII family protein [Nitrosomonas marina]|uniref:Phage regulatory protein CII (CP76) n=1 Tax=Nitrosomonas marina TaxID=917 RepID=A0A1H8GKJ6_9PROT|nr:phage regulatory CII family protein [Nitrosomonas marina]SEN43828.1 hypothetical protein SAMN05216325_11844 [Nitrosomonas marina]